MWVKQEETIPQFTINRFCTPFSNGWFIIVLPTLYTIWLFNIAMVQMAHLYYLQMIFPARNLHVWLGFSMAMLVIARGQRQACDIFPGLLGPSWDDGFLEIASHGAQQYERTLGLFSSTIVDTLWIPSGKLLHNELERSTMLWKWVNPLFQWPCSIVFLSVYQAGQCSFLSPQSLVPTRRIFQDSCRDSNLSSACLRQSHNGFQAA